jgi:hypothetical protein
MFKKLIKILTETTATLAFTFAGMTVVLYTSSGDTRRIAAICNISAVIVTYIYNIISSFNYIICRFQLSLVLFQVALSVFLCGRWNI